VVAERETETALSDYARRWEVETLFGCLKTRGFCLEATHVTEPERLRKLLALVALAFCWAQHVKGYQTFVLYLEIACKEGGC
jgi:hypothetical protein